MKPNTDFMLIADGAKVLTQGNLTEHCAIEVSNGIICGLKSTIPTECTADKPHYRLTSGTLVAGFIDTQVNGGGGVMFNHVPTLETLRLMMQAHRQFGTTAMLPTVITDDIEVMQAAADAVAEAIDCQVPGIIGIHFEGPHLSLAKRGCHPPAHLRGITEREWQLYLRQDLGVRLITLAPESATPEQIKRLVASGAIVSLGHSNADGETVLKAIEAGASGFTHLYNGMSALTSREPGMVGAAFASENTYCGIILDGQHVHPISALAAWRAKGAEHLMLVTDAMSPLGSDQTEFQFFDGKVVREGMTLRDQHGSLAGSVLDMASAVRYAVTELNLGLSNAVQMATRTPAEFIQRPQLGDIAEGKQADWVWLDDEQRVLAVWIAGELLYQAEQARFA
ncbi:MULTISPECIES: N-acetylgalactosamine-6-phosphate deacetylase AgaAII [Shewanella]|uniref:N-acetylgalactosamine-6-phosphate deacetylase AgaAII n=1 Tax=Shewanella TaxID=22 RepID=UPI00201A6B0C|nr:N-acetylgalactosamine-6-phosphate deacetylase AgaAII [Shewanella sp. 10B]